MRGFSTWKIFICTQCLIILLFNYKFWVFYSKWVPMKQLYFKVQSFPRLSINTFSDAHNSPAQNLPSLSRYALTPTKFRFFFSQPVWNLSWSGLPTLFGTMLLPHKYQIPPLRGVVLQELQGEQTALGSRYSENQELPASPGLQKKSQVL